MPATSSSTPSPALKRMFCIFYYKMRLSTFAPQPERRAYDARSMFATLPLTSLVPALLFFLLATAPMAGCTRPNPDFCCTTESDCRTQGVTDVRFCDTGRVCIENSCRAAECQTSGDCMASDAPYCVDQLCAAKCVKPSDCVSSHGPLCAIDGVCVECVSNADCPEQKPRCDPGSRTCEDCQEDGECASGVCLAADRRCAEPTEIIYLSETGADETCTERTPCRTFDYAFLLVGPNRRVIRFNGPAFGLATGATISTKEVYLDGAGTRIYRSGSGPIFTVGGPHRVTLEGMAFELENSQSGIESSTEIQPMRAHRLSANSTAAPQNALVVLRGAALVTEANVFNSYVLCSTGALEVHGSRLTQSRLEAGACSLRATRNRLENSLVQLQAPLLFENNVVHSSSATCASPVFFGTGTVRFNTFICRHSPPITDTTSGHAIRCKEGDDISSNIFAWDSARPVAGPCDQRYLHHNVFPNFSEPPPLTNRSGAPLELFLDLVHGDYHLTEASIAREAGDATADVDTDIDGKRRPAPAGTIPDSGAFESP